MLEPVPTIETELDRSGARLRPNLRRSAGESKEAAGLAEKVYRHVLGSIRSGQLAPNSRLTQRSLSAELKVSQVVVREAFERLEQQGWIERKRNQSAAVKALTENDRVELYWIREMIEVAAVRHMAKHATKVQLGKLQHVLKSLSFACDHNDVEMYHKADVEFHTLLVKSVRNARLIRYYETIAEQIHQLMAVGALKVAFHWTTSCELMEAISHEKIYQAISEGKAELAGKLLSKHIQLGAEVVDIVSRARSVISDAEV